MYDPNNSYWKQVDGLIENQENIMQQISSFTIKKNGQAYINVDIMVPLSKEKINKKRPAIEALDFHSDENSACSNLELSSSPTKVSNRD